jgi:hypothetical protein
LATNLTRAGEGAARGVGLLHPKGQRPDEPHDWPVIGRLFTREGESRVLDDFYTELESLRRTRADAKAEGASPGKPKKKSLLGGGTGAPESARLSTFEAAARQLSELNARRQGVEADMSMSESTKRFRLRLLEEQMQALAKAALAGAYHRPGRGGLLP